MRALDTNVLVFAEIRTSPQHERALAVLLEMSEGAAAWALPWPCVYEFLRVVTHPRVYHPPVPIDVALQDLDATVKAAVSAGARVIRPVENQFYGDRSGTIEDPFGHHWHIATHVEDVPADEMARRAAAKAGASS